MSFGRRTHVLGRFNASALALALCVACGAGDVSTPPHSQGPPGPPARGTPLDLTWLRANARPLRTFEVDDDFSDLQPLKSMIGTARVIGLGEGSHGTHEFFAMKHRLVRFLVKEMGFTNFAIEATWAEAYDVDTYVRGGPGDPAVLLSNLYFWTWNTQEVLDMIQWMRAYNAGRPAAQQVGFYGFDMQFPRLAMDMVDRFLVETNSSALRSREQAWYQCYRAFQDTPGPNASFPLYRVSGTCRANIDSTLAMIAGNETALVSAGGRLAYDRALRAARIVQQNEWVRGGAGAPGRDGFMAENAAWLLDRAPAGAKIMLWAHNGHLGAYPSAMGAFLRTTYGADYLALGFAFDSGSYNTYVNSASGINPAVLRGHIVEPSPDSSYERQFAALGMPRFLVDLRPANALPAGDPGAWLLGPRAFREASETWNEGAVEFRSTRLPATFDLLMYIDRSTITQLLPFKLF